MNDRGGFRDDQQAGRALSALLAPVPFRDLWSEHGPTARARVFLDRDTCSNALSAGDRFRLFSAHALWLCHQRGRLLRWHELLDDFRCWDRSGHAPPVQVDEVDGRTAGDVRELVSAVHQGPAAVDGWLIAYASSAALHDCDPESLIAVLALVDSRRRKGEPYPSFADVAHWTGLPRAKARAVLERLEAIGWARPPEIGRGDHARDRPAGTQVHPVVAVRSAIEALVRVQARPRAALLAELARFDVALVAETLDAMLREGRVRLGPGGRLTTRSRR